MRRSYSLRRSGHVVTFKAGRYIEAFDVSVLGIFDTAERIKWAAITCGIRLNEQTLHDLLLEARGL